LDALIGNETKRRYGIVVNANNHFTDT